MNLNLLLRLGLTLNICVLFPVVSKDLFLQSLPKKFVFIFNKEIEASHCDTNIFFGKRAKNTKQHV